MEGSIDEEENENKKRKFEKSAPGSDACDSPTYDKIQDQVQKKRQRQKEASKEMLFKVYGNVIATLEEYERRQIKDKIQGQMPLSAIDFPNQAWKSDNDVKANVEVQLMLYESQQKASVDDITEADVKELRKKTIYWSAVRAEKGIELDTTDTYIAKLYEILVKGAARHEILDRQRQPVSHDTMRDTLPRLLQGQQRATDIDKQYHDDPNKKAIGPNTRQSTQYDVMGARRIYEKNNSLLEDLQEDLPKFTNLY